MKWGAGWHVSKGEVEGRGGTGGVFTAKMRRARRRGEGIGTRKTRKDTDRGEVNREDSKMSNQRTPNVWVQQLL